jgi:hypothetical protein
MHPSKGQNMVRRISDKGGVYHEPPYTEAEEDMIYKAMDGIVSTFRAPRPSSTPQPPPQKSPPPLEEQ